MLDSVCKYFSRISRQAVKLQTNKLDICDGHNVDITAEAWNDVVNVLTVVEVIDRFEEQRVASFYDDDM
jgi:hypothetical protein